MLTLRKTSKTSSNIPLLSTILFIQWAHYIFLGLFFHQIHWNHGSPVFSPSIAQSVNIQSGRNIRHLPCVIRRSGVEGVCMFAIDCIKANGTHLGTCIDRFYFGSCCKLKDDGDIIGAEIVENSIDQNTIPHFSFGMPLQSTTEVIPTHKTTSKKVIITIKPIMTTIATVHHHNISTTKNVQRTTTKQPTSTTTKYTPITTVLNTESKTEDSNEQHNPNKITIATNQNEITTRMPTSTEENVKLQTFQSVQEEITFATPAKEPLMTEFITLKPTTISTLLPIPTISDMASTTHESKLITKENLSNKLQGTTVSILTVASIDIAKTTPKPKPISSTSIKRTTTKITTTQRPTPSTLKVNDTNSISTHATHPVSTSTERTTVVPTSTNNVTKLNTPTKIEDKGTIATTKSPIITTQRTAITTVTTNRPLPDLVTWSHSGINATKNHPEWILISSDMPLSSSTTRSESMKTTESTTSLPTSSTSQSSIQRPTIIAETTRFPTRKPQITSPKTTTITVQTTTDNDFSIITEETTILDRLEESTITTEINDFDHTTMPIYNSTTYKIETTTHSPVESTTLYGLSPEYEKISTTKPINGNNGTLDIAQELSLNTTTPLAVNFENTTEPVSLTIAHLPVNSTNLETFEIEGSSITENVTLEFVDLPTTEAIPSSTSISQYLETANFKQVCGKRMYPEPRIVGGSKASFGRWPWQISLRQWRTSTYLHKCGAALLNENWAITAAHCVDNVPPSDLLLRLGEYDLAEEEEPYLYQERRVQIVASHPQFDPRTFEYDLALLRFYEPVVFQPNIIPVCVPETDENFIGRTAFVTGWGRLYEDGPLPSVLQEVSVPVINNTLCESMYRNAGYIEHIPHIFICAGYRKGGYDSCEGDSGGPMVIQREDKRFLLAGVISWGIGCAEPNQPGVYTRISDFREWINQILQF